MANNQPSGEVVGWFHAARDDETYHLLGQLGLEQVNGVFVVREGDVGIAWQIDDLTGDLTPQPDNVHFGRGGPTFTPRDPDRDRRHHRAWTYHGHYPYIIDLPYGYNYEAAVSERAGSQFHIVIEGMRRAGRRTNFNPAHYDLPKRMVQLVEVMFFLGPPPPDAASLYSGE